MGTTNRKLPKHGNVEKLRTTETVRKRGGADLQNGWWGRHGNLYLTNERLLFHPTPLDSIMGAKRHEMGLDEIVEVERLPKAPDEILPGGKRPRVIIHTAECGYEFMVGDIDAWIDAIEIVYAQRARNADTPHVPTVVRSGSTTGLLDPEAVR